MIKKFGEYKKNENKCSSEDCGCACDTCEDKECVCNCHEVAESKKVKSFIDYIKEYGVETEEEVETEVETDEDDDDDMGMPSPFPIKRPSVEPAPKATLEDVIKRTQKLYNAKRK